LNAFFRLPLATLFLAVVSANEDSDDVSVLLGKGDGTFGAELRFGVGEASMVAGPGGHFLSPQARPGRH
jgi:hypothetical protein